MATGWILASARDTTQPQPLGHPVTNISPPQTVAPTPKNFIDISLTVATIRVSWFSIDKKESLVLLPNYSEAKTSTALVETNACLKAINAGFYTKEHTPIGLFVSQSSKKSAYAPNQTMNGVFALDEAGNYSISPEPPDTQLVAAVQTGPILYANGEEKRIKMVTDEPSRRSVAGLTRQNTVYFLSFFDPQNPYKGPTLTDMPQALTQFQSKTGILLSDAINLDGGSASAFYDGTFKLEELTFVGSLFCIR